MRILARLIAAVLFLTLAVDASAAEAATKPSPPRSVKATPANTSVKITWVAPRSNGGARIDKYAVQRWAPGVQRWRTVKTTTPRARSWTNTGLRNGTTYYFRVLAHNRRGWGPVSRQVNATPRTVPTAPRYLEADVYPSALGSFWHPPVSTGGAPIDYYRVEISLDGATWTRARHRQLATKTEPELFDGLTPGTRYWLRVRAHNAAGFSVGTSSGPYRAIVAPGPVTALDAVRGDGQVELSWAAPEADIAAPAVADYKIEQSDDDGANWNEVETTTNHSVVVTGLTNETSYRFRVSARSTIERVGYGTPAEVSRPTGPLNVAYAWDPDAGQYVLTWDPPTDDGGLDLTGYAAEFWTADVPASEEIPFAADATSGGADAYALTHTAHLKACNELGCSDWSAEVGPIPGPVGSATGESVSGATAATVTLDWEAPTNVAVTVVDYTVSRSTDGGATWELLGSTTDTAFIDDAAALETAYQYRIVANGEDGSGEWVIVDVATGPAPDVEENP